MSTYYYHHSPIFPRKQDLNKTIPLVSVIKYNPTKEKLLFEKVKPENLRV